LKDERFLISDKKLQTSLKQVQILLTKKESSDSLTTNQ
jgi:hypothetical protein